AKPSLYLSDFFERNRASYYDALMRVRTSNDLIHWVRFFLSGVAETAAKGRDVFRQILALRTATEQAVQGLGKRAALAQQAVNAFYSMPVMTAGELTLRLGITHPTANRLLSELVRLGVLVEVTGRQKGRAYAFDRYFRLFLM
ncbi:MAG: Fic family protein, partial [Longimicrobiales bacterium]